jgi:uncharacterized membrane protein AbrB (regulator of aidB expression)
MTERWKGWLIGILVVVWSINVTLPIFVKDLKTPPEAHVAFMTVIGVLAAQKSSSGGSGPP